MAKGNDIQNTGLPKDAGNVRSVKSTKKVSLRKRMSMQERIAMEKSLFTRMYLEQKTKIA